MGNKRKPEEFEQADSYKNWLKRLGGHNKQIPKGMLASYQVAIKQYISFYNSRIDITNTSNLNLDQILEETNKTITDDPEDGPDKVLTILYKFEDWLQGKDVEGYFKRTLNNREKYIKPISAHQKTHAVIRGFYTHNKVWLPKHKGEEFQSDTRVNDRNHAIFVNGENEQLEPSWEEFRFFLSKLNFRDQTIALGLLTTSQDVGDFLSLDLGFVRKQEKAKRLYWEGKRQKTKVLFRTFFSKEATIYLRKYVELERKDTQDEEPIFITQTMQPVTENNISDNFRFAAKNIGVDWDSDVQCPYRPKRMRTIFSTACYTAGLDPDVTRLFMGHKLDINAKYRDLSPNNLEQFYSKVEPLLTVFSNAVETQVTLTRIGELEKDSQSALKTLLSLTEENNKLKDQVKEVTNKLEKVETFQKRLENLYSEPLDGETEKSLDSLVDFLNHIGDEERKQQLKTLLSTWAKVFRNG